MPSANNQQTKTRYDKKPVKNDRQRGGSLHPADPQARHPAALQGGQPQTRCVLLEVSHSSRWPNGCCPPLAPGAETGWPDMERGEAGVSLSSSLGESAETLLFETLAGLDSLKAGLLSQ